MQPVRIFDDEPDTRQKRTGGKTSDLTLISKVSDMALSPIVDY